LGAAQAALADEKVKSQHSAGNGMTLLRAAKGGSVLRRIARAAKWFAMARRQERLRPELHVKKDWTVCDSAIKSNEHSQE